MTSVEPAGQVSVQRGKSINIEIFLDAINVMIA